MQSYKLLFIFVINIYCGQFYRSLSIETPISYLSNVAISPNNDNIVISSNDGNITLYNISGHYQKTISGKNSSLIGLFWNKKYLISVDENGNIVTRYSDNISLIISSKKFVTKTPINVDANEFYLGINYGNRLYIYNNSMLQQILILLPVQYQKSIISFAFKKEKENQNGLFTIQKNLIGVYDTLPNSNRHTFQLPKIYDDSIINSNPSQSNQFFILNSNSNFFYQQKQRQFVKSYSTFFKIVSAIYSSSGRYIFVLDQLNIITIFKDGQFQQKIVNNIQCNITKITTNLQILAFVDSCGFLHVFIQQQQNTIPFWYFIIIGLFVTLVFICVFCIIKKIIKIIKKIIKRKRSRLNGFEQSLQKKQIKQDDPDYDPDAEYQQKLRRSGLLYQPQD